MSEKNEKHITLPLKKEDVLCLTVGDFVYLTGEVYVARDAAHKRFAEAIERGCELPIDVRGQTIYYMGPSPAREGRVIGSAGPTTSGRMDKYTPMLLDCGLVGMIGKGKRSDEVRAAVIKNRAVYFAAVGGAGALLSRCITESEVIAYEELGAEALRRIKVKNFPCIVAMDSTGKCIYDE